MKATKQSHDWHCHNHDTYGWRGEECKQCPAAPYDVTAQLKAENSALKEQVITLEKLQGVALIESLRAEIDSLKEQVAQLELEKEYRYVENILRPIRILLKVAECAESLADNSEEMEGEDGRIHVGMAADFDELSDALDLLDELPDDKPGYVLGGAAKAAWALHDIIGDTND